MGFGSRAIVTGCPTLFLNPKPNLGQLIEERAKAPFEHVAVAAGHPKWKHLSRIEASLVKLMNKTGGCYIVQSPSELVSLARGEASSLSQEALNESRDYACPGMSISDFIEWSRRYCRVFFSISDWMECLRAYDFVVGARIHGVMLGLQAGVPSLCIAHDSRTRELCETMHVPFVMANDVANGLDASTLRKQFVFDGRAFDENRRVLARRLNNMLLENALPASQWLSALVNSS